MGLLSRHKILQEITCIARMISWWEFTASAALLVNIHPKSDVIKMEEAIIPFGMEYIKQSIVHKVENAELKTKVSTVPFLSSLILLYFSVLLFFFL